MRDVTEPALDLGLQFLFGCVRAGHKEVEAGCGRAGRSNHAVEVHRECLGHHLRHGDVASEDGHESIFARGRRISAEE